MNEIIERNEKKEAKKEAQFAFRRLENLELAKKSCASFDIKIWRQTMKLACNSKISNLLQKLATKTTTKMTLQSRKIIQAKVLAIELS